ncbi:MAG: EamA family transporter [Nitrospirae bacterium]|nr:EamA family transporter [Nitrospirota bacterium]
MGYLKIILAIVIWSSLGVFVRKADMPLASTVFYPALFSLPIQFLILYKNKEISLSAFRTPAPVFYLLAPCSLANTLLFFYAFKNTTIANAVLTHYTAPIFVAILAPILLREKSSNTIWLAIMISSIGLWLMLGGLSVSSGDFKGVIAGTASGLVYAMIILLLRTISKTHSSVFIVFIQNAIIALLLLPFASTLVSYQSLIYLISMGLIHSTIAPLLYVQGFRTVKANEAAVLGYFEPIGAVILAIVFFNEIPGINSLLGGALILLSGFLILRARQE